MIPVDDPLTLSRLFHLNSEPWLNEQAYREAPFLHEYMDHTGASARVDLPAPEGGALARIFAARQSVRAFAPWTMPLATLSELLFAAHGVIGIMPLDAGGAYLRRSVPSAGALYPLEIFLLLRDVENLEDGIYGFDPRSHALDRFSRASGSSRRLALSTRSLSSAGQMPSSATLRYSGVARRNTGRAAIAISCSRRVIPLRTCALPLKSAVSPRSAWADSRTAC